MLLSTFTMFAALGLDPEKLINKYGLIGLGLIVFAETGLLVGFFLPGDSLLFTAGLLCATGVFDQPIWLIVLVTMAAAVVGDQVGYRIGTKAGPALFDKPKSKLFHPKHVMKAQGFFDKHGPKAIVLARFVPIVRTFTPVIAGVGRMQAKLFSTYNIVGGIVWGGGVTMAGYLLGKKYPALGKRIELLSLVIIAISVLPIVIEFLKHRREKAASAAGRRMGVEIADQQVAVNPFGSRATLIFIFGVLGLLVCPILGPVVWFMSNGLRKEAALAQYPEPGLGKASRIVGIIGTLILVLGVAIGITFAIVSASSSPG